MDISFLSNYLVPVIIGICLCVGYILKNVVTTDAVNKYIPLVMGVLGVVLAVWVSGAFTADIILEGLASGLASTGMYELFKNFLKKE